MGYIEDFYRNPDLGDGFGSTRGGRSNPHRGLDHPKGLGAAVPSLAAGVVVDVSYSRPLGNVVEVRHDDGMCAGYRHLRSAGGPHVRVGQRVERGTKIGEVSDTGTAAAGYHLCQTIGTAEGAVYGVPALVTDPWPWVQHYVYGAARPSGSGNPGASGAVPPGEWAFNPPAAPVQAAIQQALGNRGRYDGPVDGVWGPNSIKGIQVTAANVGYDGPIDGEPGPNLCYHVQVYAQRFGDYSGPIDRVLGPNGWAGFRLGLERP